jgi:hypothetical protein
VTRLSRKTSGDIATIQFFWQVTPKVNRQVRVGGTTLEPGSI